MCPPPGSGVPVGPRPLLATTVRGVLHPVGELSAAVYWRRRLTVLAVLLAVLGGLGWLGFALLSGGDDDAAAATRSAGSSVPLPALERVVPTIESASHPRHRRPRGRGAATRPSRAPHRVIPAATT